MSSHPKSAIQNPKSNHRIVRLVLALIPLALAAGVAFKGRSFDPAFFTPAEGAIPAGMTLPEHLEGWTLREIEWFPEAEMYRKINGRAQFYQTFGVEGLLAGTWRKEEATWDMYVFTMRTASVAAGVFAAERPPASSGAGQTSHYALPGLYAAHAGRAYVQFVAGMPDAPPAAIAALARRIVDEHLSKRDQAADRTATAITLPADRQVADSAGLYPKDAFGYTALTDVCYADYAVGASHATWFLAAGGAAAFAGYTNELARFGAEQVFRLPRAAGGEMFGAWEVAGLVNGTLAGVRGAASKEQLLAHWAALQAALERTP